MAIDRVGRARRRQALRDSERSRPPERATVGASALGVEGLFNPGARHQLEQLAHHAVVKEDDRESGGRGSLDLDGQIVRIKLRGS
ncbi:hypothetical protein [Saccharopolyspora dendranthemae]|uniref:Uncharacterized protein n=1 Tax=Saccharopolyspora dendranthemae TaxID=1181886 RepID=A0A561U6J3_9PSEU|nr:hypothetical protein [Saccharopolyspora dendranthemae]TWF94989.1 hypothetical protein FHU35_13711 [Saccharopolyspora dendranthemae]